MFKQYITKTCSALAAALLAGACVLPSAPGEGLGVHHFAAPVGLPSFSQMTQHGAAPNPIPAAGSANGNGNAFGFGHNSAGNVLGSNGSVSGSSSSAGSHDVQDGVGSVSSKVPLSGSNGSDTSADSNNRKSTNSIAPAGMQAVNGEATVPPVYQGNLAQGVPGIHAIENALATASPISRIAPTGDNGIHVVAAQGTVFRHSTPSVIDLTSGQLLVSSRQRQGSVIVRAAHGQQVVISKSADVLVTADGDKLRVQNLTGMGKTVKFQSSRDNGARGAVKSVSVDPGYEVVSKASSVVPSDIMSGDGIPRRNAVVVDNGSLGVSEVHLASLITNNQTIRTALHQNSDPSWQKQLSDNLVRTAAAISTVRGDDGFTSSAVTAGNEADRDNLGQAVSAAAHAAKAAGERVSDAVHEVIQSFHESGPPPPPPPPPPSPPPPSPPPPSTGSSGRQPTVALASANGANTAQQATNSARQQALAIVGPLQPQNIDTTRPRITDFTRLLRQQPQTAQERKQNRAKQQPTPAGSNPVQANVNGQTPGTTSSTSTAAHTQNVPGSGPPGQGNLLAANAARRRGQLHLPNLSNIPPLVQESIQKHPNIALAVGILIFILLCITAYFAYIAHKRAGAIQAQMTELNVLNRQLEIARDQAIEASRLKSQFVANISHEIRTPMSAVLGTIGLLFDTKLDAEQKEIAAVLKESARSLLDVINDILDFSKIEAGMVQVQTLDFSPTKLVREVADIVRVAALDKGVQLVTNIDLEIPDTLRGDSFRLRQILLNLANNAVKFTAEGSVLISAKLHHIADNQVWLQFTVKDTGIGISDEAKQRLFQPFVQADGSTTRQFGGTGLGLSISKKLAELLGGTIQLESTLGKGSTFTVLLPLYPADGSGLSPAGTTVGEPSAAAATAGGFTHRRVLVAEDSPVLQRIIKTQLEKLGFSVDIVGNGAEAVEKVQTGEYSLVLMDWQMPVMDGLEATRTIRSSAFDGAVTTPIIAMTAHAMEGHRDACLAAGMNDYISKPFSAEQLKEIIERWCPPDNA